MYAFLSKVFGRKKDDRDVPSSSRQVLGPGELLGGRFEAVSPNVSPSAQFSQLPDINEPSKDKAKDAGFSFFKGKWRPASPDVRPTRKLDILPHLSLNFQETKAISAKPDLGLLFSTDQILSDVVIGQRRLKPLEALILVQACSRAIIARGLETLGIMHPHWYAASHRIQRRVISHFIYLLNLENVTSLPSPASPTSPISAFEAEVNDTFSPHDIAAILRWGLRHVQIEGDSFGTDDEWYKTFLESESAAGYPPKAFSDLLTPLLPTTHLQLLTATLEIFSSLAAHAEVNGTSGSKLCMLFGLWLLTAHRVEDKDDWQTFYARWERTGRMLEHLFLSRIRDQSIDQRMPNRLLELVNKYPYNKGLSSPTTDLSLLPHPPFTTHLHNALFVRIEIELPYGKRKPCSKLHPLLLLADAFSTTVEGEYADLWAKITAASKNGDSSSLSNIFTDDTMRFISFVQDESIGLEVKSPTFSLASPTSSHKPPFSVDDADKPAGIVAGPTTEVAPLSSLSNGIGNDWAQFSASGFLEVSSNIIPLASTLLDTDIEKTIPPEPVISLSRRSSKRSKAASPSPPRKSLDFSRPGSETPELKPEILEEQKNIIKASEPQIIQLDEAFIDFWSDSLLDPISANWPTFIICKFNSSLEPELMFGVTEEGQKQKTLQWLVLEQAYTIRTPPVASIPALRPRPSSPGSPSGSSRKRFSFWSVSRSASTSSGTSHRGKKKDQELRVGEMGELLEEESKNKTKELTTKMKLPIFKPRKSSDIRSKSVEATRKPVIKPEEATIDEETAVAAMVSGVVIASAAVVITNELPTAQLSLVEEAVTPKTEVDRYSDSSAIEGASITTPAIEVVAPSPEPTVKGDGIPLDVVSSVEAKVETESLEWENPVVEKTAIGPEMIVVGNGVAAEDRVETDPMSETDPAPIPVEEMGETVGLNAQDGPIVAPLLFEAPISERETEIEVAAKADPTTAEESPASELETSQAMEVAPAVIDHSPLAESEGHLAEVREPETIERESKLHPKVIEAEPVFSSVEEKTDVASGKTSNSTPILTAAQEVAPQEIIQPPSNVVLEEEDVVDDEENQVEVMTAKLDEGTAEHIETKDIDVEVKEDSASPSVLPDVTKLPEVETEASAKSLSASVLPTSIEHKAETAHSNVAAIAEGSPETALDGNAVSPGVELQSEPEQETLTVLSTTPQEAKLDVVSTSKDTSTTVVVHEAENEVEAQTHGTDALIAVTAATVVAAEFAETDQPVVSTTEADSRQHVDEAFVESVPLATTEDVSGIDRVMPDVTQEVASEAENDSLDSGTNLNIEPQQEDARSLHNPTSVPLPIESESNLNKTEVESKSQVEAASMGIDDTSIDVEVQSDLRSTETASNFQKDIEAQTQVDDISNIKDELVPESDARVISADIEGPFEDAPAEPPKEDDTDVAAGKTSNLAPMLTAAHDIGSQEIIQPQSNVLLVAEDVADDGENHIEELASSRKLEEGTAEHIEAKDIVVRDKEAKHDFASPPVPYDVTSFESEVETEASAEPLSTEILSTSIEHKPETLSNELAAIAEGPPETALDDGNAVVSPGLEPLSELEQEAVTVLSTPQETTLDVVSTTDTSTAVVVCDGKTEVEAPTHETDGPIAVTAATVVAAKFAETEQPVIPITEVFTQHVDEAFVEAAPLASTDDVSGIDKITPHVTHEAAPEVENDLLESGTNLNTEPQQEDAEILDIHSTLHSPTPVTLPLELESSLVKTEVVAENPVEAASMGKSDNTPADIKVQPDLSSTETAPDSEKDIEAQTQVDDIPNIKDGPVPESDIPHIEFAVIESPVEDAPAEPLVEDNTDVATGQTSHLALILTAGHEVDAQEIIQPQSDVVLAEDIVDDGENKVEELASSRKMEDGTADHIETKDIAVKDQEGFVSPSVLPVATRLEPEAGTEASSEPLSASIGPTSIIEHKPETAHSNEPAALAEGTPETALDGNAVVSSGVELQSESVIKPEEATIDEETAVAAMVSGVVIASAAVMITNELPTAQPSLVEEAVTPKTEVDRSTDSSAIEAVSTTTPAMETVAPSPEPTVKGDGIPLSTASPDVVSSVEAKVETESLEWENPVIERTAIEPEMLVVGNVAEAEGPDPMSATQASVTDWAPIPVERMGGTIGSSSQDGPIVASEAPISERETEIEVAAKPDPTTAEESPASELETSQAMEVTPAVIDRSLLAESESSCVEVSQPETELESKLDPKVIEVEPVFSPEEDKIDAAPGKTSSSTPILTAAQEVASQEVILTPSNVGEDVVDDDENQAEVMTAKLDEGTAEHMETKDVDVEDKEDSASPSVLPEVTKLEPEVEIEASAKSLSASVLPTSIEHKAETAHSNELAAIAEGLPETALDGNAVFPAVELQSEAEKETLTVLSTTPQGAKLDVVPSSKDTSTTVVVHEAENEVEAQTHGTDALIAVTAATVVAAEFAETEQPAVSTTEADSRQHVDEAFVESVPLATTEDVSGIGRVIPAVTHETALDAENGSLDSGTNLNIEPQRQDAEILDIHSSFANPISVPPSIESETSLDKTEMETENPVEVTSMETIDDPPIDVKIQTDPSSTETVPDFPKDIEAQTQVDDISTVKDEPVPESDADQIESADIDGPHEDAPAKPMSSSVEDNTDLTTSKTNNLAPILTAPREVNAQEVIQPQSNAVLVAEDVVDDREKPVEVIASSAELEEDTAEHIETKNVDVTDKEAKHGFASPVSPNVTSLESEVETEASAEPLSTEFLPTSIENKPETAHSNELAAIAEGPPEITLGDENAVVSRDGELQSEPEQETVTVLSTHPPETKLDVVSTTDTSTAVVVREGKTEVEAPTHETDGPIAVTAATVVAAKFAETEQPVIPTTEGDSRQHVDEASVESIPLANTEDVSGIDKVIPDVPHEAATEAEHDSLESGTNPNIEPQEEDVEMLDIHSSVHNNPTSVPLPVEPETSLNKTEGEGENQVDGAFMDDTPIEVKVQPDPNSIETAPDSEKDIEAPTQVDDISNIKDEPVPESHVARIESADIEGALEDASAQPMFSPEEDNTDVATSKTSNLDPILTAAHEVDAQEIIQPQSHVVLVAEDVVDDTENHVEGIASPNLEEGTAEHIETRDIVVKDEEDFASPSILHDVTRLEPEVETEASTKSLSPAVLPTSIEHKPETIHSNELAAIAAASPDTALDDGNAVVSPAVELQSELQYTPPQETPDVVSTSKDTLTAGVVHEAGNEAEAKTHGTDVLIAVTVAAEFAETEQCVISTTKGDSRQHVDEASVESLPLANTEDVSGIDKVIPDVPPEAATEAGHDSLESGTNHNIEPQEEDAEILDIHSSLLNNPTSVPLPLEPETSFVKTEVEGENQVEAASMGTTCSTPTDVKVQPDPSLSETAPDSQKEIEAQAQVDDTFNTKEEPIPESDVAHHPESADIEVPHEVVPVSNTNEYQNITQLESEVAPAEEEPSSITQVEAQNILPRIECEGAIPQSSDDTISIPEEVVASVANVEDQIVAPVDVQSEHATVVETSFTDGDAEVSLLSNVEESPETLAPPVASSYKSSDNEIVGSHIIPEVVPEVSVVPTTEEPAAPVELDLEAAENISLPSQELSVNPEPEEPVSIAVGTEPELLSTNSASEDKIFEVEKHELLSSENPSEPGPKVAAAVVVPVLGTLEFQAQRSVERATEEVHAIVEAPSEPIVVPNEVTAIPDASSLDDFPALAVGTQQEKTSLEGSTNVAISSEPFYEAHSTAKNGSLEDEISTEPVKTQLQALPIPETEEGSHTAEVNPQIILPIMEASPTQIEEDRLVPAAQDDPSLSEAVYAEPLDAEPVSIKEPAMMVGSDATATSMPLVPTPAIDVDVAQPLEVQEDKLDTAPVSEPYLPSYEIKTEGSPSIEKGDAVQDPSPSQISVVVEVQPEAQVMEETFNTDASVAAVVAGVEIPVVTNAISNESAVSAPRYEEDHPQQFEAFADSQASNAIVINDSQDVIPSHEFATERDDIAELTTEDGAPVAAVIPELGGESILPDLENIVSGNASQPEVEPPLSDRDIPSIENPQDNTSIPTVELDTSSTHTDEMLHGLVKDEDDVAAKLEPSVIAANSTSESSASPDGPSETIDLTPDAQINVQPTAEALNDVSDVANEHERSAMESHLESVDPVQSDPMKSALTNPGSNHKEGPAEPAAPVIYSEDRTAAAEVKVNTIEEVFAENQGNTVTSSTQTEDIFDRDDESDPTTAQVKGDAEIEDNDPVIQTAFSKEANPEESSVTTEYPNGRSDINNLSVEPTTGVEYVEESLVLPAEVVNEPGSLKVDEVGPELQDIDAAVPGTITTELWSAESSDIDNPSQGPQVEPEAKDDAPDMPEKMSQIDIVATAPIRGCEVDKPAAKEPLESASVLLEPSVEQPEVLERIGSPITESSISATETGTGQTNVTAGAFEELKYSMGPPEIEGISPEAEELEKSVDFHMEVEEAISSTTETSVTETGGERRQPVTVVPDDLQAENVSIAQAEEDPIDSAPQTEGPIQDVEAPVMAFKVVENPGTADPERASVVSEPAPEELQIDNDRIAQSENGLVDHPPSPENPMQEEADASEAVESSFTDEPSTTDTPMVVSEPATVVHEGVHIENSGVAQVLDPLPIDSPVQEVDNPPVEFKEAVENSSTTESTTVSESATVPGLLRVDSIQTEEHLVGLPTDNLIQEGAVHVAEFKETVENPSPSIAEPSVVEIASVASEPATVVLEEPQTEDVSIAPAEDIVDPSPPTESSESVVPDEELQTENVSIVQAEEEYPSIPEPSPVTERASIVSELAPEELQIDNDRIALAEEDMVDHPPLTENPIPEEVDASEAVESSFTDEPSVTDTSLVVVSEPATVVHEGVQIENETIAQAEGDDPSPLPTDNPIQETVSPLAESKEVDEKPSTAEPSVAKIASVASDPVTVVPEKLQIENVGIAQAAEDSATEPSATEMVSVVSEPATVTEERPIENDSFTQAEQDLVDLPLDNPLQEETDATHVEFKEAAEDPSTAEPSLEGPSNAEELLIDTDRFFTQAEDDPPSPTDKPIQEEALAPVAEFKEADEISSTAEPSVTEIASVVSEPISVLSEDLQIENDNIAQPEENLADPPTLVESKEPARTDEPSVAKIVSVVAGPTTVAPEEPQIENDSITQAEEDLVDPPPPNEPSVSVVSKPATGSEEPQIENYCITKAEESVVDPPLSDSLIHEDAPVAEFKPVEIPSTSTTQSEPSVAEIVSAVSEPPTEVSEDLSIDDASVAPAEDTLIAVEEDIGEGPEEQGKGAIPETTVVEDQPQSFNETETEALEAHDLNGNGYVTATQETIGTHGLEASPGDSAINENNILEKPKESIHPSHPDISPATLEAPSVTDQQ